MIKIFVLTRDALSRCESRTCPSELITPPDDCHVNRSLSFTLQVSIIILMIFSLAHDFLQYDEQVCYDSTMFSFLSILPPFLNA
jgi:hypothetical protein